MAKYPKRPGGTPPVAYQFKPGQSGNPGGRPKKQPSLRDTTRERLDRLVWATIEGKRQRIPLKDVLLDKVLSAMANDPDAFVKFARWFDGEGPPAAAVSDAAADAFEDAEDADIYEATIARELRRRGGGKTKEDSDV